MSKRLTILTLVLALTLAAGSALAQGMMGGKAKTVEGTLVDSKCFLMNANNTTNDHMTPKGNMPNCATACAKMGIPTGILTADGNYVPLVVSSMQVAEYMAQSVRATGMLKNGSLIANKLFVKKGGKWEEVKIGAMM
ncbi:MAG: hypothetical protein ACE5IP_02175 [Terriglobia bacterium]